MGSFNRDPNPSIYSIQLDKSTVVHRLLLPKISWKNGPLYCGIQIDLLVDV